MNIERDDRMTREFVSLVKASASLGAKGFLLGSFLGLLVAGRRAKFARWGGLGAGFGMGHAFQKTQ
jgi:hypothetical protein